MPQITPESIARQRAQSRPYPTPPSSVGSASPNQPSSRPLHSKSRENHPSSKTCWIPTLDEVSRADSEQRKLIFQRLAEEAKRDEQRASSRSQDTVCGLNHSHRSAYPLQKPTSHAEIGAAAFQLVRPSAGPPARVLQPTIRPRRMTSMSMDEPASFMDVSSSMEYHSPSDWCTNVPESPATASWRMGEIRLTEEMVAQWAAEDIESERRLEEERVLRFRRVI